MTAAATMTKSEEQQAIDASQYLTFLLENEEYGIEILRVQEIKGFSKITPMPNVPHFVKGVLNLRGTVIPVIDLRSRFGLPDREYDKFTVIIVVNVSDRVVGLIVDAVSDVLNIPASQLGETPELAGQSAGSWVHRMGRIDDRLVLLLDVARMAGVAELN